MKRILLSIAATLLLANCAPPDVHRAQPQLRGGMDSVFDLPRSLETQRLNAVVNDLGQPLVGATVMIGMGANQPFANNIMTTDANGQFSVPKEWNSAQAVTIDAPGYIRATFLEQDPTVARSFQLNALEGTEKLEVKGQPINFGALPKDGFVDFSLVVPTVDRAGIFSFGVETAVSNEPDKFTIFGQTSDIPSNFVMPKQTENYGIIPVTLDKPGYRYFFRKAGQYELAAVRGRFPFKKVADALKAGQHVSSILNDFNYTNAGIKSVQAAQTPVGGQDIPVNSIGINPQFQIAAPQMDPALMMVSTLVTKKDSRYFATDIKLLQSGENRQMSGATGWPEQFSVAAITAKPVKAPNPEAVVSKRMTMAFNRMEGGKALAPRFLSLLEAPKYDGQKVTLVIPQLPGGINSTVTYAVAMDVVKGTNGLGAYEVATKKWEFYAPAWTDRIVPPTFPGGNTLGNLNRWDVSFMADEQQSSYVTGPEALRSATHMSRNTVDF